MIPVSKPWLTDREKKYVSEAMDSGWISSTGSFVQKFEEAFAAYVGVKYTLGTTNGTAACHLTMLVLNGHPGDEIIIPGTTFVATANAATYCGYKVRAADIDRETWNADLASITKLIGDRTLAINCVHLYGNMCDMYSLSTLGKPVVEDACEALGGEWMGKRAGSMGLASAFSFYANKTISTGEGGMFVTNDLSTYERARLLRGQGQTERYYHPEIGYNYRMTNVQAAIGLAQIERIPEIMEEKERVYERYQKNLHKAVLAKRVGKHSYWAVTAAVEDPERVSSKLAENGIESRRVFYPICDLPPYKDVGDCPNSRWLRQHGITMPSYPELADHDIDTICNLVESV